MRCAWKWLKGCRCSGRSRSAPQEMPLSEAKTGNRVKVKRIEGGRKLCARMAAMGIYPGVEMDLVCAGCGSPCMVRLRGGTYCLGKGVSQKILVAS